MFLPRILLLLPMILASGREVKIDTNYVVKFSSDFPNTVESIKVIGYPSEELNLSGLSIRSFIENAFENVNHIRILNISNNSLSELGDTLFASLTNLEYLDLSHNIIPGMRKPFVGLSNLIELDLSDNILRHLEAGYFFGLTNSCVIWLEDNDIHTMSTELFENKSYHVKRVARPKSVSTLSPPLTKIADVINICNNSTKLISVEDYTKGEELARGCRRYDRKSGGVLELNSLGIAKFEEDWYKLKGLDVHYIDLSDNDITHLASEMFNDLPKSVTIVDLSRNKITHLERGIIVNEHLRFINFNENGLIEIDDDVFINTNLTSLSFTINKLKDTKFAATLPPTLKKLYLDNNKINEIFRDSFSKLNKLEVLAFNSNNITVLHRDSLRGLSGLKKLSLVDNGLQKIEAGSFQGLPELEILFLYLNNFLTLDSGVFNGLQTLAYLHLDESNIARIGEGTFEKLGSLCQLVLSGNPIKKLENGTLHGLRQKKGCYVHLTNVPIKMIHGGVFSRSDD